MKLLKFILLFTLVFLQFNLAQEQPDKPRLNSMSNAFGLTAEAGATLAISDYDTYKVNYTGKVSIEYYFPSTGNGNFGLRIFGQTGLISGEGAPLVSMNPTNKFSTKIEMYGGGVFYLVSLGDALYPWFGAGVSNLWFYPEDGNGDKLPFYENKNYYTHMLAYNLDAGIKIMMSKNLSVNINIGAIVGTEDFLDDLEMGSSNDMLYNGTVGFTYYFGRAKDSDGDGVDNDDDACPDTPEGVKVDEFGCPIDSDRDRVPDYLDKCNKTPIGVEVDKNGCPLDSDKDGVPDYLDKCSDTPVRAKVDLNGCPLDTDNDGVPDYLDKCPNTPKGTSVNTKGCPIEVKKDTVTITQEVEIKELVLGGDANFEYNKSKLLPNAYTSLKTLISTMRKHPEYKWEIGGYTDAVGSDAYNMKLSKERAQAVVDYLVRMGIDRNTLVIKGYGENKPVATNKTLEGRSMNRRVEIKLLTKK